MPHPCGVARVPLAAIENFIHVFVLSHFVLNIEIESVPKEMVILLFQFIHAPSQMMCHCDSSFHSENGSGRKITFIRNHFQSDLYESFLGDNKRKSRRYFSSVEPNSRRFDPRPYSSKAFCTLLANSTHQLAEENEVPNILNQKPHFSF